jgi:hypothetical protein
MNKATIKIYEVFTMKDNIFKKIAVSLSVTLVITASVTLGMTASATTSATRTIDNDSIASGYGNNDVRSAYSYITADSLYNGDARCTSSINSDCRYYWSYPGLANSTPEYFNISIGAYLNHLSFTDTAAKYYVNYFPNTYYLVGTINQNNAPAGWNYRTVYNVQSLRVVNSEHTGGYYSYDAFVEPSGRSNMNTGADGLKVWFTY